MADVPSGGATLYTVVTWTSTHDGGYWANDWDGDMHTDREAAVIELQQAEDEGYAEARIAEVRVPPEDGHHG